MRADPPERRKLSFYRRLSPEQRREYDRSDEQRALPLKPSADLGAATNEVVKALAGRRPTGVRQASQGLVDLLWRHLGGRRFGGPSPTIKVLRTRPRRAGAEFHGLYTRFQDGRSEIKVWMLTAAHGQVVKPRTFLRTLLHEVCHHLDIVVLGLPSSFHTLGFHARESSLVRALERSGAEIPGARSGVPARAPKPPAAERRAPKAPPERRARKPAEPARATLQLDLFRR